MTTTPRLSTATKNEMLACAGNRITHTPQHDVPQHNGEARDGLKACSLDVEDRRVEGAGGNLPASIEGEPLAHPRVT